MTNKDQQISWNVAESLVENVAVIKREEPNIRIKRAFMSLSTIQSLWRRCLSTTTNSPSDPHYIESPFYTKDIEDGRNGETCQVSYC